MEAVTTHGPVNPLRKKNLESLFGGRKLESCMFPVSRTDKYSALT